MNHHEWVCRCSARLHAQWPRLARYDRDEAARQLWQQENWRLQDPEVATVEWLRSGLTDHIS